MEPITDLPRREAIFVRTCWVLAVAMTSFYPAALLQDSLRATLTLVATTLWILAALAGAALARRRRLTAGIHTLTLALAGLITIGCFVFGRAGTVVWLMLAAIGLGGFHAQPRQLAWLTGAALGSAALIWATLPAVDSLQMPVLVILLGVMGIISYQRAQITQLELGETRDANTRLGGREHTASRREQRA